MNKQITAEQALSRLENLCSRYEKCSYDVRKKLIEYKIDSEKASEIAAKLCKSGFVDDERYALAFARTKHMISKWGKQKIKQHLIAKHIGDDIIAKAIAQIGGDSYEDVISKEIAKKLKTIKAKSKQELTAKLLRFAISRGYEYDISYKIINTRLSDLEQ